jgi:asparagine synthase (glutamine-hydrolysing)
MEGFLPTEILNKPKHGFGLPFGVWMRTHPRLQELGYDSLLALKKRAYFRSDFIDHAINLHRTGHAAYYGELIWILMMLELWFQAHS